MATHPQRAVRVPDEEWQAGLAAARANGETLTDVIRRGVRVYTATGGAQPRESKRRKKAAA